MVERNDAKRHIEQMIAGRTDALELKLQETLSELFSLRHVSERTEPRADDLILDIVITHHQAGGVEVFELDWLPLPFGWRPK